MHMFDHQCSHGDTGRHQCHCGVSQDHTSADLAKYLQDRGITPLDSEVG